MKYWRYHAGEPWRNRVTVRDSNRGGMCLTWYENGVPITKSAKTRDRFKAIIQAEAKAAELLEIKRLKRRYYAPDAEIVQMRQDLMRVARERGMADGYAPSISVYLKRGAFTVGRVCAAFAGYRPGGGKHRRPVHSWMEAMRLFSLRPWYEDYHTSERTVLRDLRDVALRCGHPGIMPTLREYDRHGRWAWTGVRKRMGGLTWAEIAERANLTMPANRAASSALRKGQKLSKGQHLQPPTPEQRKSTREAA